MKKLNLNLSYNLAKDSNEKPVDVTIAYLTGAVSLKYKDGLEGQLRRIYGRIQRKFDEAIESGLEGVELEDAEFDLLEKSFNDAKFPATISKYVNVLEEELDRCRKE